MNKCNVCGIESSDVQVCSSSTGRISFAYCPRCLQSGYEPYSALVGMGLFWADINRTYKQQILIPSLNFYGKTKEDFDNDVENFYKGYTESQRVINTNKAEVTTDE